MSLPSVFIGSSTEGLEFARAARTCLSGDVESMVWREGFFNKPGLAYLETLVQGLPDFDFAILVMTPDDLVTERGVESFGPRDNVLFELGLFMGHLGRHRSFVLADSRVKLLSDFSGIVTAKYSWPRKDRSYQSAVGSGCDLIREAIRKLGPLKPLQQQRVASPLVRSRVRYFLRGVKETYLSELKERRPSHKVAVRLNVMTLKSLSDRVGMQIAYADDDNNYNREMDDFFEEGEGACGYAWKTQAQSVYASDIPGKDTAYKKMGKKSKESKKVQSVLSTPIISRKNVIGVLNLDSYQGGRETFVDQTWVQRIFSEAALVIVPLIASRSRR